MRLVIMSLLACYICFGASCMAVHTRGMVARPPTDLSDAASVTASQGDTALPMVPSVAGHPTELPLSDRVAIYTTLLRAAAREVFPTGTDVRLLLDPRPPQAASPSSLRDSAVTTAAEAESLLGTPLDRSITRAILASGAIEGVCQPAAAPERCSNNQRGLAATLGRIVRQDSDHVIVAAYLGYVIATSDRTSLRAVDRRIVECTVGRVADSWQAQQCKVVPPKQ